ncbi:MAG: SDR family oxidoreductase [Actinobacteria bacterium]|nr:SDR family oxidoreductase [Actinomycetota bacterium]
MNGDRVAVITGGSSGIGAAAADALAAAGLSLMLAGRDERKLVAVQRRVAAAHPEVAIEIRVTDVAVPEECESLVAEAAARLGRVDVAVTAAGTFAPTPGLEIDSSTWDDCLDVVLRGSFLVATAAARRMKSQGGGRVVLISSVNSVGSEPGTAHYSAAKAGIDSLARSLALDLAADRICVNAIAPGWIDTPMTAGVAEPTPADLARINPLHRLGRPEEIANVIAYLVTDAPEFLTGAVLFVDGGQTAMLPRP